jgi:hypothetical protein
VANGLESVGSAGGAAGFGVGDWELDWTGELDATARVVEAGLFVDVAVGPLWMKDDVAAGELWIGWVVGGVVVEDVG